MALAQGKRVLFALYASDYYAAYLRMINNLGETYNHHNYALRSFSHLAQQAGVEAVTVVGCTTETVYNQSIDLGIRVVGASLDPYQHPQKINQIIAQSKPTHLILGWPMPSILKWGIRNNVKIMPLLADSFSSNTLKSRFHNFRLAKLLNHPQVEWVGNHHIKSCLSLQRIGVSPTKLIPWDWPRDGEPPLDSGRTTPLDFEPKALVRNQQQYSFIYVGAIYESKGVGDIIEALAILRNRGLNAHLKLIGGTHSAEPFKQQALSLKIEKHVEFLGIVPNDKIIDMMHAADIVFVPSRHDFPEGLPSTIFEAFCSRTPLIASDHPMFLGNVIDGYSGLIFPAREPQRIVECVEKLIQNPELYSRLSHNSIEAWKQLLIPVTWANLTSHWIADTPESHQWLRTHTLLSGTYNRQLKQLIHHG